MICPLITLEGDNIINNIEIICNNLIIETKCPLTTKDLHNIIIIILITLIIVEIWIKGLQDSIVPLLLKINIILIMVIKECITKMEIVRVPLPITVIIIREVLKIQIIIYLHIIIKIILIINICKMDHHITKIIPIKDQVQVVISLLNNKCLIKVNMVAIQI